MSALIISSKSLLVNYYKFSVNVAGPASSQGSLVTNHHMTSVELQSLLFLQAALIPRITSTPSPEFDYIRHGVRFYQAWSLASNLELSSTLYTVHDMNINNITNPMHNITAPTRKIPDARRREAFERIKSHFIVADGDLEEDQNALNALQSAQAHTIRINTDALLRLRINWMDVYRRVFCHQAKSSDMEHFMKHLESIVVEHVNRGKERNAASMSTL